MINSVIQSQEVQPTKIELSDSSSKRSLKERIVASWDSVKVGIAACCAFIAAGIIMGAQITLISAAVIAISCLLLIAGSYSLLAVLKSNFTPAAVPTNQSTSESSATPTDLTTSESSATPTDLTTSESPATPTDLTTSESSAIPADPTTSQNPAIPTDPTTSESPATPTDLTTSESPAIPTDPTTSESSATSTDGNTHLQGKRSSTRRRFHMPRTLLTNVDKGVRRIQCISGALGNGIASRFFKKT